jgi:tungstate transport system ATP-binding protein
MEHIFSISGLRKTYGNNTVLNIDKLHINKDEITAIIGPSGSGKSTLLQILNHIEPPTCGKIVFDKTELPLQGSLDIETRRQMVMLFQKPVVFSSNVYENIAYSLKLRKVPVNTIKERVAEIADIIGLKDKLKQNAKTLSGGEAQRVAVARAIILRPKVLLMDEPTSNLDPANVTIIENLIKHANSKYNTSIVIVTHNMNQAKRLANQVVFLLNGNIVEYGDSNKLFLEPENHQTRAFISGDMIY